MWVDVDARSDEVKESRCKSCGAPVLKARVGRAMALDVVADPTPLDESTEVWAEAQDRMIWCVRRHPYMPTRMYWSETMSRTCLHERVADHRCPEEIAKWESQYALDTGEC